MKWCLRGNGKYHLNQFAIQSKPIQVQSSKPILEFNPFNVNYIIRFYRFYFYTFHMLIMSQIDSDNETYFIEAYIFVIDTFNVLQLLLA